MTCIKCKGNMIESTTTYAVELEHVCVVVRHVPCLKCEQCGDVFYRAEVAEKLLHIVKQLKNAYTEIAIVSYSNVA